MSQQRANCGIDSSKKSNASRSCWKVTLPGGGTYDVSRQFEAQPIGGFAAEIAGDAEFRKIKMLDAGMMRRTIRTAARHEPE